MTSRQPSAAELAAGLTAERTAVEALTDVLKAERSVLGAGQTDQLPALAARKRELLLHIAHLGESRNRLLEACGATPDRRGMENLLAGNPGATACRNEWQALIAASQQAQRLNQENGVFIEAGMRANQQALSTLVGAARSSSTYSAAGRACTDFNSRSLASA